MKKLYIFDMDGTILNTLDDLSDSVNHVLKKNHFPQRTLDEVRTFVGNGIRKLIERALPEESTEAIVEVVYSDFMEYYQKHCADKTRPYDGIVELLDQLKEKGIHLAVVSNKAEPAVKELCDIYFPGSFECAIGVREGILPKPAPDGVDQALEFFGIKKEEAVYIGDSEVDVKTALNSGLDMICVEWGFRDRAFIEKQGGKNFVRVPEDILEVNF